MVVLPYYFQFFCSVLYKLLHVYILQYGRLILPIYISLIQIKKRIKLVIPCFYQRACVNVLVYNHKI